MKIGISAGLAIVVFAGILFATGVIKPGRFNTINLGEYAEVLKKNIENGNLRQYAAMVRDEVRDAQAVQTWIADGSASIRFYKWGAALNGFLQYPLFGYGTGVTRVMDGNYTKLLGETGIIGTLLWLVMFGYYMRVIWSTKKMTASARYVFWMGW